MAKAVSARFWVLALVEHAGRFLVINEAGGDGWYLPAGGVEPGESLVDAVVRETLEEAGVRVEPGPIVHVDQQWSVRGEAHARLRFVFRANAVGPLSPKGFADQHSLGAAWMTADELRRVQLRGRDILGLLELARSPGARFVAYPAG
jgi:phosphatase NudJ